MIVDLHTHSTASDGVLTPAELVAQALAAGVELMALTDHDTMAGCESAAAAARDTPLELLAGIELSTLWRGRTIHILGIGIDPGASALRAHCQALCAQRIARTEAIGERLTRRARLPGRELARTVLEENPLPTRAHLARALVAQGHARSISDAFARLLGPGSAGHIADDWPAIETTMALLRDAGGNAVIAHPSRYRLSAGALRSLLGEFAKAGGAAIESDNSDAERCARLAGDAGLALSLGSDFHDPQIKWNRLGRFDKLAPGTRSLARQIARC
ncbi:MAG: PHP domain-containing protein [Steroidobacteraceae bacterium]